MCVQKDIIIFVNRHAQIPLENTMFQGALSYSFHHQRIIMEETCHHHHPGAVKGGKGRKSLCKIPLPVGCWEGRGGKVAAKGVQCRDEEEDFSHVLSSSSSG